MESKELIKLIKNPTEEDITLIEKAYKFAEEAHKNVKRFSGEPYLNHCFETAKNLAEIGMGPVTIAAGLLHDTLEDAGVKEEEIKNIFGEEILFLVQGVTKFGKYKYRGLERHVESLRKFFIAMSQDIRILIIKLADRLHNMRTLQYVPKEKQCRIASETLEIYAPLAYRLGIRKFTRELEDLAFMHLQPENFEKVNKLLKQNIKDHQKKLEKFSRSLKKEIALRGITQIRTSNRVKNIYSLYNKLLKKEDIDKIYDTSALRVIVPTVSDCYKVLGIIHGIWRPLPGRIKDYIAFPKPNGYQSLHTTIFTGDGGIIEVQIRTEEMHLRAEYGIAAHINYKEKKKNKEAQQNFVWIKNLLPSFKKKSDENKKNGKKEPEIASKEIPVWIKEMADSQSMAIEIDDFIENLKTDFTKIRVFVFTPRGDVVDLPVDSSVIDFAYAIHSDVGDHIFGAKVNSKQASLHTKLKNGDIVEIQTRNSSHPSQGWLEFAKTSLAKKHIKSVLEKKSNLKK